MKKKLKPVFNILLAFLISSMLLLSAFATADAIKTSEIISQSYFLGNLIKEDGFSIKDIIFDPAQRSVVQKYLSALASASVDFELIPYQEAETFRVILAAMNEKIVMKSFKYSGHDVTIKGSGSQKGLEELHSYLVESGYFDTIEIIDATQVEEDLQFEIACYSKIKTPNGIIPE